MQIIKLYRKPNKPEFYVLGRHYEHEAAAGPEERVHPLTGYTLLTYPIESPDRKRSAKWVRLDSNDIHIDWIRTFYGT